MLDQVALTMDPAHLISPPRAHPSGVSSGESIHGESILNEPWFMIAVVIVLVVLLMSAAFTLRFLYNKRKNLSKGLQHLSGELTRVLTWRIIARGILIPARTKPRKRQK